MSIVGDRQLRTLNDELGVRMLTGWVHRVRHLRRAISAAQTAPSGVLTR